jgi:pimeloyl-ACP methyl ester carboxylesterase
VAGLILLGTGAHLPVNPWILEMVQKDFPLLAAKVNAWSWGPGASEEIKTLGLAALLAAPPEVVWGDYQACAAFDLRAQLAAITAPSLVLCGQADKMTPPAESEFLAVQLPQAELRLFAGLGHNAMLEDGPAIAGALQSWLQARGL